MSEKVAVIDLGTNTFHLIIADWKADRYEISYRERIPAKIGMGGINDGVITQAGIERAIAAMKEFKKVLSEAGILSTYALGTSALRNARNGEEVAQLLYRESGISVKIIPGEEEAYFIYQGVRAAVKMNLPSLVVDIGGGSVEFIIGDERKVFWKQSFEIGAQRLLERFQKHDPILPEEVDALNIYFTNALSPLFDALAAYNPLALVGSSGTFDTLSEMHCIRQGIPYYPNDGETPLSFKSFYAVFEELLQKNRAARMQMNGMIEMRVDMIVVACCLIAFLLRHHTFDSLYVSTYSLKEGVLASLQDKRRQQLTNL